MVLLASQAGAHICSRLMETILKEIERALEARLWYAAVVLALTLPDICAKLEAAPNARKDGQQARYRRWCRRNLSDTFGLSDDLCWYLRCGVVHEGRYKHKDFDRVVFTTPDGGGVHNIILEIGDTRMLSLHVLIFCEEMMLSVRNWYDAKRDDQVVSTNLQRLVQLRPEGLLPIFKGAVVIG